MTVMGPHATCRRAAAPPNIGAVGDNRAVTLNITIDPEGADAPYEQVRAQISERARSGELPVGYRLPTVRGLAEELGLAANTVAKAYRALESDGVIETRGRNGTFVAAAGDAAARQAAAAAATFAAEVRRLGLSHEAALAAAREGLRAAYDRVE
ncbi:DNA-binding transcriptional regulator YhcF (GntR family) [Streptomyces sp. V4I23]|nr:DNA-binding transcriptional regulator YhcF (GntR family) [Streptomyces sp. V4I23]